MFVLNIFYCGIHNIRTYILYNYCCRNFSIKYLRCRCKIFTKKNKNCHTQIFIQLRSHPLRVLISLTCLSAIIIQGSSMYSVNYTCGSCNQTSGCSKNLCLKMTGELTVEVCLDNMTCPFTGTQTFKIGRCSVAVGGACSSGL